MATGQHLDFLRSIKVAVERSWVTICMLPTVWSYISWHLRRPDIVHDVLMKCRDYIHHFWSLIIPFGPLSAEAKDVLSFTAISLATVVGTWRSRRLFSERYHPATELLGVAALGFFAIVLLGPLFRGIYSGEAFQNYGDLFKSEWAKSCLVFGVLLPVGLIVHEHARIASDDFGLVAPPLWSIVSVTFAIAIVAFFWDNIPKSTDDKAVFIAVMIYCLSAWLVAKLQGYIVIFQSLVVLAVAVILDQAIGVVRSLATLS